MFWTIFSSVIFTGGPVDQLLPCGMLGKHHKYLMEAPSLLGFPALSVPHLHPCFSITVHQKLWVTTKRKDLGRSPVSLMYSSDLPSPLHVPLTAAYHVCQHFSRCVLLVKDKEAKTKVNIIKGYASSPKRHLTFQQIFFSIIIYVQNHKAQCFRIQLTFQDRQH